MPNLTEIDQQINLAAAAQTGHEVDTPTFSYTQGYMDALRWVQDARRPAFAPEPAIALNDIQKPQETGEGMDPTLFADLTESVKEGGAILRGEREAANRTVVEPAETDRGR